MPAVVPVCAAGANTATAPAPSRTHSAQVQCLGAGCACTSCSAQRHRPPFYGCRVKFRDAEELQVLTGTRQSGGERSVSTMMYLISIQVGSNLNTGMRWLLRLM